MGAKRPGANRPGAKRLGGELDLGRNDPDSNARPRLRLADLLTEVVILQLRPGSER